MKLNKKLIFVIVVLFIIIFLMFYLSNKKNVLCELNHKALNTKINVELNKNITFTYDYLFDSMDESVDKYDEVNSYFKRLNDLDGVQFNINQLDKKLNYSINIDLTKVKEEDYKILNITEIKKLKDKKEIIEYYEKQGFTCKVI